MTDISKAKEQALNEVKEEKFDAATAKYKQKLRQLANAKKVVENIEREIEDLDDELENG